MLFTYMRDVQIYHIERSRDIMCRFVQMH